MSAAAELFESRTKWSRNSSRGIQFPQGWARMGPDNKRISPPPPHNIDAERSVLGAILLDNSALGAAAARLKPEDFFFPHHQVIFRHMVALGEVQRPIDLVTLFDELQSQGVIAAAGGEAYLAQLVDGVPRVVNVEHYALTLQ